MTSTNQAPESTAASRVFAIAELTEAILLFSSFSTVITFQRVDTFTNSVIKNSQALQRKLFHTLEGEGDPERLVPCLPELIWHMEIDFYYHCLMVKQFPLSPYHATSSWNRLLLTQPPVHELTLEHQGETIGPCCEDWDFSTESNKHVLQSPTGITLGDIDEAAREILDKYGLVCRCGERHAKAIAVEFEGISL